MKNEILKLRSEGKSYNEIKNILGCAKSTISYHCTKIKKDILEESKYTYIDGVSKDVQKEIINYRKLELKFIDIYIKIDKKVTRENIRIICKKNNLSYIDRLDDKKIEEIRNEYKKIGSAKKVAKIVGSTFNSVKKYTIGLEGYKNKRKRSITKSESVINWRIRTRGKLIGYKGGECVECGYKKCLSALHFHHIDPNEKDFTISGKSWSFERLKEEVDKCILLCSNCHIELHEEIQKNKSVKIDLEI